MSTKDEKKKNSDGLPMVEVLLTWIQRALILFLLKQTQGKGTEYTRTLSATMKAIRAGDDFDYLKDEGVNLIEYPPGRDEEDCPPRALPLSKTMTDFVLKHVFEELPLRGVVAVELEDVLQAFEDVRAGRYKMPGSDEVEAERSQAQAS